MAYKSSHAFGLEHLASAKLPALADIVLRSMRIVSVWTLRQRSRRALSQLDPHLLDDIGLSAPEARDEAGKPFWRD